MERIWGVVFESGGDRHTDAQGFQRWKWGLGSAQRREPDMGNQHQHQHDHTKGFLCSRHLTCIISLNPPRNPRGGNVFTSSLRKLRHSEEEHFV